MKKAGIGFFILILLGWASMPNAAEVNTDSHTEKTPVLTDNEAQILINNSGVFLKNYAVSDLEKIFAETGYDEYINPPGNTYPRIFVQNIPADMAAMENLTERNRIFIKILMPWILKANQEILSEREKLLAVKTRFEKEKEFSAQDCAYLEKTAQKYEYATPFRDSRRCMRLLKELLRRVDIVPPSILVSAAAINTDWGTSRAAVQANNLYKSLAWYTKEGLPSLEESNEPYRYKIYPSLEQSIKDYIWKVNTQPDYEGVWISRQNARKRSPVIYGKRLAWAFALDNNLPNYAGLLAYTLTYYKFRYLDEAVLEEEYAFEN